MFRKEYILEAKAKKNGENIHIAGWVHEFRNVGKLRFLILRDKTGLIQIIAKKGNVPDEVFERFNFNKEDVVEVKGTISDNKVAPDGKEVIPTYVNTLNTVSEKLPVDPTGVTPSELDTRLKYRYIDLRKPEIYSLFKIKATIENEFRGFLTSQGFLEANPSAITGTLTEGGTDVFPIQYFENKAYLVQSPQLYKQMLVLGGIDKVFITMPVFRAEKHNTTTHLNEITQMDIEMGFADYNDGMDMLEKTFKHLVNSVLENNKKEIAILKLDKHLKQINEITRYTYTEIVDLLNKNDVKIEWGEDFSKEQERQITLLLNKDAFIIYDWPTKARSFYSMPHEDNPEICHAYDLMYKGLEIASGAQRIHKADMILEQLKKRGIDPKPFDFYIEAFKFGAPPHAGWSIGLERITQTITNTKNIREVMLFPRDRTRYHP